MLLVAALQKLPKNTIESKEERERIEKETRNN
jgi:hypothetical protein